MFGRLFTRIITPLFLAALIGLMFYFWPIWLAALLAAATAIFVILKVDKLHELSDTESSNIFDLLSKFFQRDKSTELSQSESFNIFDLQNSIKNVEMRLEILSDDLQHKVKILSDDIQSKQSEAMEELKKSVELVTSGEHQISNETKNLMEELVAKANLANETVRQSIELEQFRITRRKEDFPEWYNKLRDTFIWLRSPETIQAEDKFCNRKHFLFAAKPGLGEDFFLYENLKLLKEAEDGHFLMLGFAADPKTVPTGIFSIDLGKYGRSKIQSIDEWQVVQSYFKPGGNVFDVVESNDKYTPRVVYFHHGLIKKVERKKLPDQEEHKFDWKITRPIRIEFI